MKSWAERRAYVILVVVSLLLSVGSFMLSVNQIHQSNHKFCALMLGITATPVPKPAHPKIDKSRERSYEFYVIIKNLSRSLGCESL
jgi:hypothetical protein